MHDQIEENPRRGLRQVDASQGCVAAPWPGRPAAGPIRQVGRSPRDCANHVEDLRLRHRVFISLIRQFVFSFHLPPPGVAQVSTVQAGCQ